MASGSFYTACSVPEIFSYPDLQLSPITYNIVSMEKRIVISNLGSQKFWSVGKASGQPHAYSLDTLLSANKRNHPVTFVSIFPIFPGGGGRGFQAGLWLVLSC